MSFTRETYYGALWTLLQTLGPASAGGDGTFSLTGRRVQLLDEMENGQLPALFMMVHEQDIAQRRGLPPRHALAAQLYLYAANPDQETSADMALNGLIDAVEQALNPYPASVQTLGGLVSHCWIEGKVEVFGSPLGERAAAILTVNMLVP